MVAVCVLLLAAAGCGGWGGGSGGDPVGEAPASTRPGGAVAAAGTGYGASTVLGTVTDPAIDESSGLAASRRSPGLLWTHNDSGDDPLVYCLDFQAHSCGVWRVAGAQGLDWGGMAARPGGGGGGASPHPGGIGGHPAPG